MANKRIHNLAEIAAAWNIVMGSPIHNDWNFIAHPERYLDFMQHVLSGGAYVL